ncbi:hypothetical protein LSCM1_03659 [Leishmania martiniquensis]|uniref:Integral membrane protein n=1 Tax=Leishmania martiniquensis TaxID=1580590 RepID=A0A836GUT2_9TRYP|nr:hypothetical protein LSCM1_03659 [Leishmania martiniquensis]
MLCVRALLRAAALVALAAVSRSFCSALSGVLSVQHDPGGAGSGRDDARGDGRGLVPLPASGSALLLDDKWANVTLDFLMIFMSVCAVFGMVALIVILCAYCREYKLMETSSDSDTESVCSRSTSHSTNSGDSPSSLDWGQAYATQRQRNVAPSAAANEVMTASRYEEADNGADLLETVIQAEAQPDELHGFSVQPGPSLNPSGETATTDQLPGSRLSLACSRRGSYRKVR